jgi:hypothetical protein
MMTLKEYILHQLREMKREMLVAIEGLSKEDLTSHEPGGHSPIAWIVQHCLVNVDFFIHKGITGEFCLEHEERFRAWPLIEPKPGDRYPAPSELVERWTTLLDASIETLEAVTDERLQEASRSSDPPEPLVQSCLRVVNHQNAHLRQIWCILGRRRVDEKWPEQQTWLA